MTEAEWLTEADPTRLIQFVEGRLSARKRRLLAAALCRVADRHAHPDKVALKMMTWAWKIGADQRGGLTPGQFVRQELTRLRLGEELEHVTQSGRRLRLPPLERTPALVAP